MATKIPGLGLHQEESKSLPMATINYHRMRSSLRMKNEKFIINHMSKNLKTWDYMIIIFAIYNSLFLPFELAFRPEFLE